MNLKETIILVVKKIRDTLDEGIKLIEAVPYPDDQVIDPPEPNPDPIVTPGPIDNVDNYDLILMRGETSEICVERNEVSEFTLSADGLAFKIFAIKPVTTLRSSFQGAEVGNYEDLLEEAPRGNYQNLWIDVTANKNAVPGNREITIDGKVYKIKILNQIIPDKPTLFAYVEYASWNVMKVMGLEDHVSQQAIAAKQMNELFRSHRIEPIKQWILRYPNPNINLWSEYNASFKQLVIDGAIAPPCIFGFDRNPPSIESLKAIESWIKNNEIPSDSWCYTWDEGQPSELTQLINRSNVIRINSPSLTQMATWEPNPIALKENIDIFCPVMDWFKQPNHVQEYTIPYWLYTSCMAQGSCTDGNGNPTGTPMFVTEAPAIHQRAFPVIAYQLGAEACLYYKADKLLSTSDQPGGIFNEGGNGDGTLLYLKEKKIHPSMRLKNWRKGLNDVEYLKALGYQAPRLVRSTKDWEKDCAVYNQLRVELMKKESTS